MEARESRSHQHRTASVQAFFVQKTYKLMENILHLRHTQPHRICFQSTKKQQQHNKQQDRHTHPCLQNIPTTQRGSSVTRTKRPTCKVFMTLIVVCVSESRAGCAEIGQWTPSFCPVDTFARASRALHLSGSVVCAMTGSGAPRMFTWSELWRKFENLHF